MPTTDLHLSDRQLQLLNLLSQGKSNKEIAFELNITEGTVKQHLFVLYKKLGATNRAKAVIAATELLKNQPTDTQAGEKVWNPTETPHYVWRMVSCLVIKPRHHVNASPAECARFDQQMSALQAEVGMLTDGLDGLQAAVPGLGLLVCFGIPKSHLDDPARALFLASRVHLWLRDHGSLKASIGIATATEVVADNSKIPYRAESIEMARALATRAAPMQMLASEITCRLAGPVVKYSPPREDSKLPISHREVLLSQPLDFRGLAAKTPLPFISETTASLRQGKAMWIAVEGWPPQSSLRLQDATAIALQAEDIATHRLRLPANSNPERTGHCAYTQLNILARLRQRPEGNEVFLRTADSISRRILESIKILSKRGPLALVFQGINTHAALQKLLGADGIAALENYPVILVTSVLSENRQDSHIAARVLGPRPNGLDHAKNYRLAMPKPPLVPQGMNADLATLIDTLSPPARALIKHIVNHGNARLREAGQLTRELLATGLFNLEDELLRCRDESVRKTLAGFYVESAPA